MYPFIQNLTITDYGLQIPRSDRSDKASQVIIRQNPYGNYVKIGTLDTHTMLKPTKLTELSDQMNTYNLDLLGICEIRWTGNGDYVTNDISYLH